MSKRIWRARWERVLDEDLYEDGLLTEREVQVKIINKVLMTGEYRLFKRREDEKK